MTKFKFYEVGGKIRDELLGLKSKDVDYVAVPSIQLLEAHTNEGITFKFSAKGMFIILEKYLREEGFEIFLITPDCYTIRAKFPKDHKYQGIADFVMARKEIGYVPGTRTPIVEPGNLYDDLSRRDFTVNAMAKDPDTGEIIDYFNGKGDLEKKLLKTPLNPMITFNDDPLRILRCIRFCITKNFSMSTELWDIIESYNYMDRMPVVSTDRIREELHKCFKEHTRQTIWYLKEFTALSNYIFMHTNLWLKPTSEQ